MVMVVHFNDIVRMHCAISLQRYSKNNAVMNAHILIKEGNTTNMLLVADYQATYSTCFFEMVIKSFVSRVSTGNTVVRLASCYMHMNVTETSQRTRGTISLPLVTDFDTTHQRQNISYDHGAPEAEPALAN